MSYTKIVAHAYHRTKTLRPISHRNIAFPSPPPPTHAQSFSSMHASIERSVACRSCEGYMIFTQTHSLTGSFWLFWTGSNSYVNKLNIFCSTRSGRSSAECGGLPCSISGTWLAGFFTVHSGINSGYLPTNPAQGYSGPTLQLSAANDTWLVFTFSGSILPCPG